ncbi:MaoC/PaaZ C-terminal domain-containing protein [Bacillus sp. DJP31]|uniref:MaoC/PaaZ C-terminal domain-containing protein n=1 Tax=Bacillus sp. DJP31 TaxID=3409789 RepID=UPI003BB69E1F
MLLGKKRKLGRRIEEMTIGEKLILTEKIEDKDLLLYLGLTNDSNPLFIQHDYASQTPYKKPIVPSIMLTGIISAAVSKYLPGPGSMIIEQHIRFLKPVYHYATIQFLLEVTAINMKNDEIEITVKATDEEEKVVIEGNIKVSPPVLIETLTGKALENF